MGNLAERWGKVGSAFSLRKGETKKSHSSTGLHRLNFVLSKTEQLRWQQLSPGNLCSVNGFFSLPRVRAQHLHVAGTFGRCRVGNRPLAHAAPHLPRLKAVARGSYRHSQKWLCHWTGTRPGVPCGGGTTVQEWAQVAEQKGWSRCLRNIGWHRVKRQVGNAEPGTRCST